MNIKRFICIFIVSFIFATFLNAQTLFNNQLFSKALEMVNEKGSKGKFKGQLLKGKRNGMGVFAFKNGSYYVGDFYRDNISGFGMILSPEANIDNCNDCFAYAGNWKEGKKNGFGRCYNSEGELIYQGQFENDEPTGEYPMKNLEKTKSFLVFSSEGQTTYIGETSNDSFNGFGLLIFGNGDMWISGFKDGEQKGIGLYLQYDGEWETLNFKKDGNCDLVSSSVNYRNIDLERKSITRAAIKGALDDFGVALQKVSEMVTLANHTYDDETSSEDDSNGDLSNSSKKTTSKNNSSSKSSGNEASNKNRDSNSYSNYESQLIKMNTYHESQYDDSQRRSIQQKMKSIRTKWEGKGYKMFHSQWEDWDGRKR